VKNKLLWVKYNFGCGSIKYWSKKPVTHTNVSHWLWKHSQWPSVSFRIVHQLGYWEKSLQKWTASNYYGEICNFCWVKKPITPI